MGLVARGTVPTGGTVAVWAAALVRHDVEAGEVAHVHGAEHVLGVGIDLDALLDLEVHSGDIRDVVETLLTLLLLELQRDALDGTTRDALHHVGGEPSNLVAKLLGGDECDFIADALVGVEVERQALVVTLDDLLRGSLHSLVSNTAHFSLVLM